MTLGRRNQTQAAFWRQGVLPNTRKQIVLCFSSGHLLRSGWAASSTDCWRAVGATCAAMEATRNLRLLQGASRQGSIIYPLCSAELSPLSYRVPAASLAALHPLTCWAGSHLFPPSCLCSKILLDPRPPPDFHAQCSHPLMHFRSQPAAPVCPNVSS